MNFTDSSRITGVVSTDITDIGRFSVKDTFDCGQCFRWIEQTNGSFTGVYADKVLNISNIVDENGENSLRVLGATPDFVENELAKYLDLHTDYDSICAMLADKDEHLRAAIEYAGGIRLLKQEPVETIFSFIISANNNVPRIMGIINRLCRKFGKKCEEPVWNSLSQYEDVFVEDTLYTFPTLDELVQGLKVDFLEIGAGYRAEYIVQTVKILNEMAKRYDNGLRGWYQALSAMTLDEARKEMLQLCGVGPKVADCILLFSGVSMRAFPTDVWVKRVMELLYFRDNTQSAPSIKKVMSFADEYFGDLAGYAQQYLFHYARMNKLGVD